MKKKMIFTAVLSVLILGSLSTPTVHAAKAWYTCTVVAGGSGDGTIVVALTDDGGAFTRKWFNVEAPDTTAGNRHMSTILTAISTGKKLYLYVDPSSGSYPYISNIYIMN